MKTQTALAFSALAIAITGAPATAATFSYHVTEFGNRSQAGSHKEISTTFDDDTDLFTWSSTFTQNPTTGAIAEGGWLVVNDGPMPRKSVFENVIFYLDGSVNRVSAYAYDGDKAVKSWETSTFLDSTELEVNDTADGDRTLSFDFDMSTINSLQDTFGSAWEGTTFDEKIGVWFHGVDGLTTNYTNDGKLSQFEFKKKTSFDVAMKDAKKSVPEPATTAALGMTMAAAAFTKLRKRSA